MAAPRDSKGRFLPRGSGGGTVADDLDSVTSSLGVTSNAATDLRGVLDGLGVASGSTGSWFQKLSGLTNNLAGGLSNLLSSSTANTIATEGLTAAMGPYGQIVEVVIQRVTFLASKLYDLAAAAVTLTQEKDALRDTFDVFTGGAGDELLGDLEELASKLPYTGDQLNAWAKSLLQAGIAGDALKTSVQAIAASAAITKTAGTAAEGLIKRFAMAAQTGQQVALDRRILNQLADAGVLAADLAKVLGVAPEKLAGMKIGADKLGEAMQQALIAKGAKSLAVVGQSVTSIAAKLKEGWEDAFEDLGDIVGPFMGEVRSLASEFFAGSIASGVLKDGIRGLLTPAFEAATRAVRAMHVVILQIEIAYLKAAIAMHPITAAIDRFIPKGAAATVAFEVLKVAFIMAAGAAVVFGVAMFIAMLPLIVLVGAIALVVYALYRLGTALYEEASMFLSMGSAVASAGKSVVASVIGMVSGVAGALVSFPLTAAQAGLNFVLGLVQAIATGQGPVADAARQLASSALAALKGAFLSRSPSRAAYLIGATVPQGVVGSLEDGEGDVEEAGTGVGAAAMGGLRGGMKGGSGGGRGGGRGMIAQTIQFIYQGPADQFDDFAERAEKWLEQMAGEGPDPEPAS